MKSGGVNVKRIFLLTTAMLLLGGSALAGELKVAVPVVDYKELKSRLEALEKENSLLKQGVRSEAGVKGTSDDGEIQRRLQAEEMENSRLRQELNALKTQERSAAANTEVQSRLQAVEKENRQLRETQARLNEKSTGGEDPVLAAKLNATENENSKLQQEVKSLKEGGLAALYAENKITARGLYFNKKKKGSSHIFKF